MTRTRCGPRWHRSVEAIGAAVIAGSLEATATLAQVAGAEWAKAVYSYNFRDDWRHDIVVEKIIPAKPGVAYPRCTSMAAGMDRRRVAEGSGSSMRSLPDSAACSPSPT